MSLFKPAAAGDGPAREQRAALTQRAAQRREEGEESESVATLVNRISVLVRRQVDAVFVHGEVRGFREWTGAHGTKWFFDLCDDERKIKCVMNADRLARVRFDVDDGLLLQARGRVEINTYRSEVRLVVDHLEHAGLGDTLARLERIRAKLRDEGLLDAARKRPLPMLPARIGIVTSREGAVIHDMMRVIRERHPRADVLVSPTRVQGRGASTDIARALAVLDARGDREVIIVARGGGAREDLYSFDMENVARAIADCSVPVVAGIGHESDVTLAELVADLRAATPTYAAQAAVPNVVELEGTIARHHRRLRQQVEAAHAKARRHVTDLAHALPTPEELLQPHYTATERLRDRLYLSVAVPLREARAQTDEAAMRLWAQSPRKRLAHDRKRLADQSRQLSLRAPTQAVARSRAEVVALEARMTSALLRRTQRLRDRLAVAATELEALSPLKVLTRGYGLVQRDGAVVASAAGVSVGDPISIQMADGDVTADVTGVTLAKPAASRSSDVPDKDS